MDQYVVIVVPPKNIVEKVDLYRKKYALYTNYVIDPHFTVYPPFFIPSDDEKDIVNVLKNNFAGFNSKSIRFDKIGYFEGKNNVVFYEPDTVSTNYLRGILVKVTKSLEGKIKNVYDDYNFTPEKYKPHMTIAERIPDDNFVRIKKKLSRLNEKGEFVVSSIFIYKYEPETKLWLNFQEIKFD